MKPAKSRDSFYQNPPHPPQPDDFPFWVDYKHQHPVGLDLSLPHKHPDLEIGYCHEGRGLFNINGAALAFKTNDVVVIGEGVPHVARHAVKGEWSWIYVDPKRLLLGSNVDLALVDSARFGGRGFCSVLSGPRFDHVKNLTLLIIDESLVKETRPVGEYQTAIRAYVLSLIMLLGRLVEGSDSDRRSAPPDNRGIARLYRCLQYIHDHYAEHITLLTIANAAAMSTSHMRRSFKATMGTSLHQYLIACRISFASLALRESDASIDKVAFDVGFEDAGTFRRAFKRLTGSAPAEWRARNSHQQ